MGIKIPICQNIKHKYTYNKKYTYINKTVFVLIVILSSLIMYANLEGLTKVQNKSTWAKATHIHSF